MPHYTLGESVRELREVLELEPHVELALELVDVVAYLLKAGKRDHAHTVGEAVRLLLGEDG